MRRSIQTFLSFLLIFALSACGSHPVVQPCAVPPEKDVVYVVGQGWHAEIGIPVEELDKDMSYYRNLFSGARVIMFGYGKRTFVTAPPETISEYIIGPFPGPAVIHVVGLRVTPLEAYAQGDTLVLTLPPGGAKALSRYIWNDLIKNSSGKPQWVAKSSNPDGQFYAASSEYNLSHTCNSWTADALNAAGLNISTSGVIFAGQVMTRAENTAREQCY